MERKPARIAGVCRALTKVLWAALVFCWLSPTAMADTPAVRVRGGEHPTYSRIVFDWTAPTDVSIELMSGNVLQVNFDKTARFDLTHVRSTRLSRVLAIDTGNTPSSITIALSGDFAYRKLNGGEFKVVIDILASPGAARAVSDLRSGQAGEKPASPVAALNKEKPDPPVNGATKGVADAAAAVKVLDQNEEPVGAKVGPPKTIQTIDRRDFGKDVGNLEHHVAAPHQLPTWRGRPAFRRAPGKAQQEIPESLQSVVSAESTSNQTSGSSTHRLGSIDAHDLPRPIFDIAAWRLTGSFADGLKILRTVGKDDPDDEDLLNLARFHFAWRRIPEAQSFIVRLRDRGSPLARRPDVIALADAAKIMSGHDQKMDTIFDRSELESIPEARLWRGARLAGAERQEEALIELLASRDALHRYPADFRNYFGLLGMETSLVGGKPEEASLFADALSFADLHHGDAAMFEALAGWRLLLENQTSEAVTHLKRAARSPARRPNVIARWQLIELRLRDGGLTTAEAMREMEHLYYNWEGDEVQIQIMMRLAQLQFEEGRYIEALDVLRAGIEQLGKSDGAYRLSKEAQRLLVDLFGGAKFEALDPVYALALFEQNRAFLPSGRQSKTILERHAQLLSDLDLQQGAPEQVTQPAAGQSEPGNDWKEGDLHWQSSQWNQAASSYLKAAEGLGSDGPLVEPAARLVLRAAAALVLAGSVEELSELRSTYQERFPKGGLATVFMGLTDPNGGTATLLRPETAEAILLR